MGKPQWLDNELGLQAALVQGMQLVRDGFRRPLLTLLIAAGLTSLVVGVLAFGKRDYTPSVVIRVVEADRDPANIPRLKRKLGDYVRQGVLTSEPLLELMRRHDLYPSLMRKSSRAALESFKEDIGISVYQNYFLEERAAGDAPRSARLTVSFSSQDPVQALAVTRDLGALIIRHERALRSGQALAAAGQAEQTREAMHRTLRQRTQEILTKQAEVTRDPAPDPKRQVELIGLLGSLESLEKRVEETEQLATTLQLGAALERRGIGLAFQVVDAGSLPSRAGHLQALLIVGGATFMFGLPLTAMAIGAFYPKRGQA